MAHTAGTRQLIRRAALVITLIALFVSGSFVATGASRPTTFSDSGPEPQLSRILVEIESNRLDSALEQTEDLLVRYPNFRLAHLILSLIHI